MNPLLISLFVALGIFLLGKFIGKRFSWSANTYLWLALLSFILALILHEKVRNNLIIFYIDSRFVSHSTIIFSALGLLCVIVFLLIIIADIHSRGIDKKSDKLFHSGSVRSKETIVNIKKRLEKDRERILLVISEHPKSEIIEITKMLSVKLDVVAFHIKELEASRFIKVAHMQSSVLDDIPYREEWSTDQLGRKYLMHHKLI
jgi:hypothetical protein